MKYRPGCPFQRSKPVANKPRQRRDAVRRIEQLVKRLTTRGGYPTIVGPTRRVSKPTRVGLLIL